ncbi:hypothetical protein [Streptomyces sp. NPDC003877]
MRTTDTPAKPRQETTAARPRRPDPAAPHGPYAPYEAYEAYEAYEQPSAAEPGPFAARTRGRHRKPRPRKVLLAAGGLVLAVGALSLVRLSAGTGPDGTGTIEAEPPPHPVVSDTDGTPGTAAARQGVRAGPGVSPSSTTALGSVTPSAAPRSALPTPSAPGTGPGRAPDPPGGHRPGITTPPGRAGLPAPPPRADAPRPAPATPPDRSAPAPAPRPDAPDTPEQPQDPGLCVPVIGLCVDPPAGHP